MPIHTVLGPIDSSELGQTSMHEHLLLDGRVWFSPPRELPPEDTKVTMQTLGFVHWNCESFEDNLILDDPEVAIEELAPVAQQGGFAIVDLTVEGLGRRVGELPQIARRSGVQIIVGCGYYVHGSHSAWVEKASIDEICELLLAELQTGLDGTGIRPGLIGEIGTSEEVAECETRVVRAAGRAGAKTGSAVNIHLDPLGEEALKVLGMVVDEGMSPDRVILSHMDERLDPAYHLAVAEAGAILEYDTFGAEAYMSDELRSPSDNERCAQLVRMIEAGYASQLLVGCDIWTKMMLRRYGGMGYDHLLKRIVPLLKRRYGVAQQTLDQILIETPRRLLDRPDAADGTRSR
jgi:phosphotriesterase-related protein